MSFRRRTMVSVLSGIACLTLIAVLHGRQAARAAHRALPVARPAAVKLSAIPDPAEPAAANAGPAGKFLRRIDFPGNVEIFSLTLSPDAGRVALAETNHKDRSYLLVVRDTRTGAVLFSSPPQEDWQASGSVLAFSPDGTLLAGACSGPDSGVRIQDAHTGKSLKEFKGDINGQLAFSGDGALLAGCSRWGETMVWDIAAGKLLWSRMRVGQVSTGIALSPDGKLLASTGGRTGKTVEIWDARTGQLLRTIQGAYSIEPPIMFSPDGRTLASTGFPPGFAFKQPKLQPGESYVPTEGFYYSQYDYVTMLWDVSTGKLRRILRLNPLPERATNGYAPLGFTPDGSRLICRDGSGLDVREVATGKRLYRVGIGGFTVALSHDGATVVTTRTSASGTSMYFWKLVR